MSRVHEIVTENIVAMLDKGVVPWRKPWRVNGTDIARNAWGKKYRGINVFLLAVARMGCGYQSNLWLTFNQIAKQEGSVKAGSKGTLVVFWKVGQPVTKVDETTGKVKTSRPFILRYFTVFNLDQTTGVVLTKAQAKYAGSPVAAVDGPTTAIEDAEAIVATYFVNDGSPSFVEGSDRAFYSPVEDRIVVPSKDQYEYRTQPATDGAEDDIEAIVAPEYYSTLFHEIGHSTGHASRLARKGIDNFDHFGSEQYAAEELVAELTAAFLCAEAGIDNTLENSAAYIANWKARLQDDPNLIVKAAGQAQKAADFVLKTDEAEGTEEE
jgi:antirestriction protein ArdC